MPYIDRDENEKIITFYENEQFEGQEFINIVPVDIEQLIASGLAYYSKKALDYRATKFILPVYKADGSTIGVHTDLQLSTLNDWLIVKNKVGTIKKANVINATTGLNEIIEVDDAEILRINTILTELVDNLTALDVRVSNKIKTASDELAVAVFTMNTEQLDIFAMSIMGDSENILLMTDEEFDTYINNLVIQIKGS